MSEDICNKQILENDIFKLQSNRDIKEKFLEKGVDIPIQYVDEVVGKVKQEINNPNEISDSSLDTVSGGASSWMKDNWGKIVTAVGAVTATGITIGVAKHYIGKAQNKLDSTKQKLNSAGDSIDYANESISELSKAIADVGTGSDM